MSAAILTEEDVRLFISDYSQDNPLLQGVRWDAKRIDKAMVMAVDEYNITQPPIGLSYTIESFPNRVVLLKGTVGYLLRGAAINEASNNFSYSAEGVSVNDKDKAGIFMQLGKDLWEEFRENCRSIKLTQNVNQVWGYIPSEYSSRNLAP